MSRKILICQLELVDEIVSDTGDFDCYEFRLLKDQRGFERFFYVRAPIRKPQFNFQALEVPDTVFAELDRLTKEAMKHE